MRWKHSVQQARHQDLTCFVLFFLTSFEAWADLDRRLVEVGWRYWPLSDTASARVRPHAGGSLEIAVRDGLGPCH